MERPLGSGDSAPPCAGVKGEDNPHGLSSPFEFPAFLFSRLQGFGASTGPVYGICSRALRAQGRSCVPPAAHLLYHGKRNGFHPKGVVGGVGGGFSLPRTVTRAWTVSDRRYPFSRCPVLTSARTELPQQSPYFFGAVLVRNRNGAAVPASGLCIREKG